MSFVNSSGFAFFLQSEYYEARPDESGRIRTVISIVFLLLLLLLLIFWNSFESLSCVNITPSVIKV